jgi:hypothetical protein
MEAETIDRREAKAQIDAVMGAVMEELDRFGADEEDPGMRACLQEAGQLMKRDIADLVALAPRVTQPDFELPPPAEEDHPSESG